MRNVPDKTCTENQYIHFLFNNYLSKTMPFMRRGKIYQSWTGHRFSFWIPKATDTQKCNTSCFSTATMVAWMHFSVTLYIYCLLCSIILWWLIRACVCVYIQTARKCPIQTLSRWMNKIPLHEVQKVSDLVWLGKLHYYKNSMHQNVTPVRTWGYWVLCMDVMQNAYRW